MGTAIDTEISLVDQPTANELEYRIIKVNRTSESEPSSAAMALL